MRTTLLRMLPTIWLLACTGVDSRQSAVGLEMSAMDNDAIAEAREQVRPYEVKLQARGLHPDRLARFLARLSRGERVNALRGMVGEIPQIIATRPGSEENRLLKDAIMTPDEIAQFKRTQGRSPR